MATQTTYYEFNKPSGTDLVNPLTDTNPNWDIADAGLHELDERSVANATETVVLGVHAISRINTYTKFIKWIATANFTAGDTFTVDGNVVAASTPSGAALETNAYVTGSVVLACLNADNSAMTIFVSGTTVAADSERLGGELPSYYATDARMTSAETDIDNIQALIGNTSIASIADGTLTGAVSAINTKVNAIDTSLDQYQLDTIAATSTITLGDYRFIRIDMVADQDNNYCGSFMSPISEIPSDLYITDGITSGAARSLHVTKSGNTITLTPLSGWKAKVLQFN